MKKQQPLSLHKSQRIAVLLIMLIAFSWNSCSYPVNENKSPSVPVENARHLYDGIFDKYQTLSGYQSKIRTNRIVFIIPDKTSISLLDPQFIATSTSHLVKSRLEYSKENMEFEFEKFKPVSKKNLTLPTALISNTKEHLINSSQKLISNDVEPDNDLIETKGVLKKDGNTYQMDLENNPAEQFGDLTEAFFKLKRSIKLDNLILPFFYPDITGFVNYQEFKDAFADRVEDIDGVVCNVITAEATRTEQNTGIYIKIWVGKEDQLIRRIDKYNIAGNSVVLTSEIYQDIKTEQ